MSRTVELEKKVALLHKNRKFGATRKLTAAKFFMQSGSQTPSIRESRSPSYTKKTYDQRRKKIIDFLTSFKGAIVFGFVSYLIFAICVILHNHVSNKGPVVFGAGLMFTLFGVFYYLGTKTKERKLKQHQ